MCSSGYDHYRTCFQRQGECNQIASSKPTLSNDESLLEGAMHLVLLQDSTQVTCERIIEMEETVLTFLADNIGSGDTYLPACVYISDHFHDRRLVPGSSGQFVESTAFELDLSFIQKNEVRRKLRAGGKPQSGFMGVNQRNLARCTPTEKALCCSQNAINNNIGEFCSNLGCNLTKCGRGRRPRHVTRHLRAARKQFQNPRMIVRRRAAKATKNGVLFGSKKGGKSSNLFAKSGSKSSKSANLFLESGSKSAKIVAKSGKSSSKSSSKHVSSMKTKVECPWYGQLGGYDFNDVVQSHTSFQPEMTSALLNVSNTKSVAICSANRWSIINFGTPSLTCDAYDRESCPDNEDLPDSMTYQQYTLSVRTAGFVQEKPMSFSKNMSIAGSTIGTVALAMWFVLQI